LSNALVALGLDAEPIEAADALEFDLVSLAVVEKFDKTKLLLLSLWLI